jgi:hypothetical protein
MGEIEERVSIRVVFPNGIEELVKVPFRSVAKLLLGLAHGPHRPAP